MKLTECFLVDKIYKTPLNGEISTYFVCGKPEIIATTNPKSFKIEIKIALTDNPFSGYLFSDSIVYQLIQKAIETDSYVLLRFEKVRKKEVDVNIPILEISKKIDIAQKNINKYVVGIYDFKNNKWILNDNALGNVEEDDETVKALIEKARSGMTQENINAETFFNVNTSNENEFVEIKPVVPKNFDRQNALITFYYFIIDCEKKYNYTLNDNQRKVLAKKILDVADNIQKLILNNNQVNYKDYSHTRARFLVFSFEEKIRNLTEQELHNIKDWQVSCYNSAKDLIDWTNTI